MAIDYTNLINNIGNKSGIEDAEPSIYINGLTRNCEIPLSFNKQIGVVGDHCSNIITFECDRYIDGHDINTCTKAYIKWNNVTAKTSDIYDIVDREILLNSDRIIFHWIIDRTLTTAAGKLVFQICFVDLNENNNEEIYRWGSNPNETLSIGKGLYDPEHDFPITVLPGVEEIVIKERKL